MWTRRRLPLLFLRNLWQLDIFTTCRKLNIPLDTVRQIFPCRTTPRSSGC